MPATTTLQIQHHDGVLVLGTMRGGTFIEFTDKPITEDERLKIMPSGTVIWVKVPALYPLTIAVKWETRKGPQYSIVYTPFTDSLSEGRGGLSEDETPKIVVLLSQDTLLSFL